MPVMFNYFSLIILAHELGYILIQVYYKNKQTRIFKKLKI